MIEHEGAGTCSEYELEGIVEAIRPTSITSVDITYAVDGLTELPNNTLLDVGDTVKI